MSSKSQHNITMDSLPNEILSEIGKHMGDDDVVRLGCVNMQLHAAIKSHFTQPIIKKSSEIAYTSTGTQIRECVRNCRVIELEHIIQGQPSLIREAAMVAMHQNKSNVFSYLASKYGHVIASQIHYMLTVASWPLGPRIEAVLYKFVDPSILVSWNVNRSAMAMKAATEKRASESKKRSQMYSRTYRHS